MYVLVVVEVEKYEFKLFLMTNDNEPQTCFLHYIITWSNNTYNMIFNGGLLVDNGFLFYFCNAIDMGKVKMLLKYQRFVTI